MTNSSYLIHPDTPFSLADHSPAGTGDLQGKAAGEAALAKQLERLAKEQLKLHASGNRALLLVLQGMDASGKDGIIRHLASGLNPQGVEVTSFKTPSTVETEHDFLWRYHARAPQKGRVGLFNRSHYEDVLIVRVHPEMLLRSKLPDVRKASDADAAFWERRLTQINAFESLLTSTGTAIVKCFLHMSRDEQRERLLARIDAPDKNWKFAPADVEERRHWDAYHEAYEQAIARTSTKDAPWHVIPADKKWFARATIARIAADALEALDLSLPVLSIADKAALADARKRLERE